MTEITIFQNRNQEFLGFDCTGHAEYDNLGRDIVCAGISILIQNTINAVEAFTDEDFDGEADEKTGHIRFRFQTPAGADAKLLMKSMILGLQGIQSSYGKKYLKLHFKEV